MKQEFKELKNMLTKLELEASHLEDENSCLKNENKSLKSKVNWLLVIISLGLVT